jgi:hypothetical protein
MEASFNDLFYTYRRNAKTRNIKFELTKDQFREFTKQNCYYCGSKPLLVMKKNVYNGNYVYNGVDRKNNNEGYTVENSVPCCYMCNHAKKNHTQKDFLDWIKRVTLYWKDKV